MLFANTAVPSGQTALDPEAELDRFNAVCIEAKALLSEMQTRALDKVGIEEASIYEVYKLLPEDPAFTSEVRSAILDKQLCAEYAVFTATTPSWTFSLKRMLNSASSKRQAF